MHPDVKQLAVMGMFVLMGLCLLMLMSFIMRGMHKTTKGPDLTYWMIAVLLGVPGAVLSLVGSFGFTVRLMIVIYDGWP